MLNSEVKMADSASSPEEETEFREMVARIGGEERIYLVGEARQGEATDGDDTGLVFQDSGVKSKDEGSKAHEEERPTSKSASRANIYSKKRAIDSRIVVFIFTQTFISHGPNEGGLIEILKDVKARTKRASIPRPALIGLVHTTQESAETHRCAQVLESLLRAVFHKHPSEAVWVGCFLPKTEAKIVSIKKNACKVVCASQLAGAIILKIYCGKTGCCTYCHRKSAWRRESSRKNNNKSSTCEQKGRNILAVFNFGEPGKRIYFPI
uniref:Uncharacterized protein n=1 Tax=Oryzias sinensis TaxID=183150 RepID=A0A8C8DPT2_9TELE